MHDGVRRISQELSGCQKHAGVFHPSPPSARIFRPNPLVLQEGAFDRGVMKAVDLYINEIDRAKVLTVVSADAVASMTHF